MPNPLAERDLYRRCPWCGKINCHAPHEGKTCRCRICNGIPTAGQFKRALRLAYRSLMAHGDSYTRKRIRGILGDWR